MSDPGANPGITSLPPGKPPMVEQCSACGGVWLSRRGFCPRCGSANTEMRDVPGEGRVTSVTTVHRATRPSAIGPAPYRLALVALDAHPEVVIMVLAKNSLQVGDPVRVMRHGDEGAPYLVIRLS